MASTDLKLHKPGSLPSPGPFGRLARMAFGLMCAWYVMGLVSVGDDLMLGQGRVRSLIWNGIIAGILLVSYVINIGYSRAWKKWPAIVSGVVFMVFAASGYLIDGTIETEFLARTVWVWELYLFSHLGAAFLLAAVIATPGCEMRAFHHLYTQLTGIATAEHRCPVGPLRSIDQWEAGRRGR